MNKKKISNFSLTSTMSKTKKQINLVEEPYVETYQIPLEQKVMQFLRIAETLPPTKLKEIVEKLE